MKYVLAFAIFAIAITFFGESSLINRMSQKKETNSAQKLRSSSRSSRMTEKHSTV